MDFFGNTIRVILLLCGINVLLALFPGSYLEVYESMISSMVAGVYTLPCINDWNNDLQFVLLALYARLNAWLPGVPVYGIVLYSTTFIALLLSGSVWFRAVRQSGVRYGTWLAVIAYTAVALDNLQNLNSDRVAFYLAAGVLGWLELSRVNGIRLPLLARAGLALVFLYACFVRSEVVLLVVLFAAALMFAFRRLHPGILLPLTVSLAFFLCYNFLVLQTATKEKQAAFYKEKQIIDRNDIDYARIDSSLKLEVDAFKIHYIMDKPHFDMAFYDAISKYGRSGGGLWRLADGVSAGNLLPALQKTMTELRKSWYWAVFYLVLSVWLLVAVPFNSRYALLLSGSLIFPFALGIYVMVPDRFLMPYFSALSLVALMRVLDSGKAGIRWGYVAAVLFIFAFGTAWKKYTEYKALDTAYAQTQQRLVAVETKYASNQAVIIQHLEPAKFFSSCPFTFLPASRSVFLNFYYFGSYACYVNTWQELCGCDPYALAEKTAYVARNGNVLVSSPDKIAFLMHYLNVRYGLDLEASYVETFDEAMNLYRLKYVDRPG